jgi:hypothetical protein
VATGYDGMIALSEHFTGAPYRFEEEPGAPMPAPWSLVKKRNDDSGMSAEKSSGMSEKRQKSSARIKRDAKDIPEQKLKKDSIAAETQSLSQSDQTEIAGRLAVAEKVTKLKEKLKTQGPLLLRGCEWFGLAPKWAY